MIALQLLLSTTIFAQSSASKHEISINGFRSPSIGMEYRYQQLSVHAGYYMTAFAKAETTSFMKVGITTWFLPVGKKRNPSSFYAGASYLRGFNRDYKNQNALGAEGGFRWMIWKGLNGRLGAIGVFSAEHKPKLNPAGGVSYSFFF